MEFGLKGHLGERIDSTTEPLADIFPSHDGLLAKFDHSVSKGPIFVPRGPALKAGAFKTKSFSNGPKSQSTLEISSKSHHNLFSNFAHRYIGHINER